MLSSVLRQCFRLQLDKLTVLFPYEHIYPEQYYYMVEVKKALDASVSTHVDCYKNNLFVLGSWSY